MKKLLISLQNIVYRNTTLFLRISYFDKWQDSVHLSYIHSFGEGRFIPEHLSYKFKCKLIKNNEYIPL